MADNTKLKKLVKWLIGQGVVSNQKELAKKLGYGKSSFSLIVNEKLPMSGKFVNRLCEVDRRINRKWVVSGEGEMVLERKETQEKEFFNLSVTTEDCSKDKGKQIDALLSSITEKDKKIEEQEMLVSILFEKLKEMKTRQAHLEEVINKLSKDKKDISEQGSVRII